MRDETEDLRAQLADVQRIAQLGSWSWEPAERRLRWSGEMQRIYGRSTPAASLDEMLSHTHPDDRELVGERFAAALAPPYAPFDLFHRIVRGDGEERVLHTRGRIAGGEDAGPRRLIGTSQDITARREAEVERILIETRLHQSQRFESMGQLAGGIAHDFNNLLGVIINYASFVADGLPDDDPRRRDAEEISRAAEQAARLTQQLLIFSRRESLTPERLDVNEVLVSLERLLRRTIGENVTMRTDLAPDLGPVLADRGQIEQVLANLILNARDAMPDGGVLVIRTTVVDVRAEELHTRAGVTPGRFVRLTVADTGVGMAPDVIERAFEPFFTTKPSGEGTGLGLATVNGIATQANGFVEIESRPGEGTIVAVSLPLADAPGRDRRTAADIDASHLEGNDETVLVVEDEDAVRDVVRRILVGAGYLVVGARGASEALRLCADPELQLDLVLTDVVMPEMSGPRLMRRLAEDRPGLPVIYMSGYTADFVARQGVGDGTDVLVQKPFTAPELLRRVRDALTRRPPAS